MTFAFRWFITRNCYLGLVKKEDDKSRNTIQHRDMSTVAINTDKLHNPWSGGGGGDFIHVWVWGCR